MSYPVPIVGVFIQNEKGEVLLIKSPKWGNQFCPPGGHIELGEKMIDAVIRETKEETDLDIYDLEFLDIDEFIDTTSNNPRHYIFINYKASTNSTRVMLNNEATEFAWLSPENTLIQDTTVSTRRVIQKYFVK